MLAIFAFENVDEVDRKNGWVHNVASHRTDCRHENCKGKKI